MLTIKNWMGKYIFKRYLLPKNLSNSKEIISAIIILNSSDNSGLVKKISKKVIEKEKMNKIYVSILYIKIWNNAF